MVVPVNQRMYVVTNTPNDTVTTGDGNDTIVLNGAGDTVYAGGGNDSIYVHALPTHIDGGTGTDGVFLYIDGTFGANTFANIESFHVEGAHSVDFSAVGLQNAGDTGLSIVVDAASNENATVVGSAFNDVINGGAGQDSLFGGQGDDTINGGGGNDYLVGGAGDDFLFGGDGNDYLVGGAGINTLSGGAGNDLLNSSTAGDGLNGGDGDDTAYLNRRAYSNDITLDMSTPGQSHTASDGTRIYNVEHLDFFGSSGVNTITGTDNNDVIYGGKSNDVLSGGGGEDWLKGGGGNDTLDGGAGTNYALYTGSQSSYTITANANGSFTIHDNRPGSPEGTDTLTNIAFATFDGANPHTGHDVALTGFVLA